MNIIAAFSIPISPIKPESIHFRMAKTVGFLQEPVGSLELPSFKV